MEQLPEKKNLSKKLPGYSKEWNIWKTHQNRLIVGVARTKNNLHKWRYNTISTECKCNSEHILICPLNLVTYNIPEDIINASDVIISLANQCSRKGM